MPKFLHIFRFLVILLLFFTQELLSQSLVLNEVSNGTGTAEYVEIVVTGAVHCDLPPDSIDIRHWIIDDNNGYFSSSSSGSGVAPGVCRFSNDDLWKNIPTGTLIVIYNGSNKNSDIGADDYSMSDGNCTLILPLNSNLFERNDNQPNSSNSNYPTSGWLSSGDWNTVAMSNGNDSYQIRDINNLSVPLHAVSYGNNDLNNTIYFSGSGGSTVYYFDNTIDDDPFNQNSWKSGSTTSNNNDNGSSENGSNDQTPGLANSTNNQTWITNLSHNCTLPPTVYAGEDDTICGSSITITASGGGSNAIYTWDNGLGTGASKSVNPSSTTQYIVSMTENGWCVNDTVIIVVESSETFTLSSTNPSSCSGTDGSITLSGLSSNTTYQVSYNDGTNQGPLSLTTNSSGELIILNLTAGNYTNFVVDISSGCPATDNTIITLSEPNGPTVNAGNDQTVCEGESVTLTASNPDGANLSWSGSITDNTAFTPTLGTSTYTVSATLNSCTSTDNVDIIVNPLPNIDAGISQTICENESVTLTASNPDGANISWSGGITDNTAFTPSLGTTTYTVTANLNNCTSTDNVDIIVNPLPTFSLDSNNPTTCGGTDGNIIISNLLPNTSYQISYNDGSIQGPNSMTSDASGQIIILNLNSGNYSNISVEHLGCSTTDNTIITLFDPNSPTINAGTDQTVCLGEQVTLVASNPNSATISWTNGITDNTPFTPSLGNTTYTVNASLNGCTSSDQVDVIVNPLPTINAGNDQIACNGESITLSASNPDGANILWDNAVVNGVAFIPPLGNTIYTVTANLNNCTSSDQVNVTINPNPNIDAGTDLSTCENETVILSANNPDGAAITWNNNVTDGIAFTPPLGNTIYTVTANLNNCTSTDELSILVNTTPIFTLSGSSPTSCGGTDGNIIISNLLPSTNYNISYYNENTPISLSLTSNSNGTITINNLSSGSYSNFVVEYLSCSGSNTTVINLTDPSAPSVDAGQDQNICANETIVLTANNPDHANISWDQGVTDGISFSQASGTVSYTVTAELNNCISTDFVNITANPITPVNAGSDIEICLGESTNLIATGGNSTAIYTWSNGTNGNINTVSPNTSSTYYVTLTQNGCSSSNSVNVNINSVALVNLGNDKEICIGDETNISVQNTNSSLNYLWNNGINTSSQIVSPLANSIYSVTISDGNCSHTDSINIIVNPLPTPIIIGDTNYCEGESTLLSLNSNYQTYLWSNNSSNPSISVGETGIYSLTVTDENNCSNSTQIHISPYNRPSLSVQTNLNEGCSPLTVNFNTSTSCINCNYFWNFDIQASSTEQSPTYTFIEPKTYTAQLIMTTENNCKLSTDVEIEVFPIPEADFYASPSTVDILNPEINFINTSSIENHTNLQFYWNLADGSESNNTNPTHSYSAIGEYWINLIVQSEHSCTDSISRLIKVNDFFQIYFPNAFSPESTMGENNYFYPKGVGAKTDKFEMSIFNRWGENIFTTTEFPKGFSQKETQEGGWNGRFQNSGDYVQNDIYIYRVRIMDNFHVVREYTGTVTLIR